MTRCSALLLAFVLLAPQAHAHGGEDHGAGAAQASIGVDVMTVSALARAYEVVLKHAPVQGGQPYRGMLYLAFFESNLPVRGAQVTIEEPGVPGRPFTVRETGTPGVYAVERAAGFARNGRFNLSVRVAGGAGAALVLLQNVYVGPAPTPAEAAVPAEAKGGEVPWLWLAIVGGLGAAFAAWLVYTARQRRARSDAPAVPVAVRAPSPPPTSRAAPHTSTTLRP